MIGLTDYIDDPSFATAVGLLQYSQTMQTANAQKASDKTDVNWVNRVKKWFQGEF
jgi:cell division protein FtsA